MPKKLTEIPVECPCFVQEVRGEGYLRLFDLGFFPRQSGFAAV